MVRLIEETVVSGPDKLVGSIPHFIENQRHNVIGVGCRDLGWESAYLDRDYVSQRHVPKEMSLR